MLIKIGRTAFELAIGGHGLFVRCWPFGQFHWSRIGVFADRWSALKITGEAG